MSLPSGLYVALATPFRSDGCIDYPAFRRLVHHVRSHVDALVVMGSTGEAATLHDAERPRLIEACLEEAGGRPVIVGSGHNATHQAVGWTRQARNLGAQGALVVSPYYNKPTQSGLLAHYRQIALAVPDFPILAYNVPSRTGINISPATVRELWQIAELAGLKESSGNLLQIAEIARELPKGKLLLAGDDVHALASVALGASGLVSVMAGAVPATTAALLASARSGRLAKAQRIMAQCAPLMEALFVESNPIPLKAALSQLELAQDFVRLPLTPAQPSTKALIVHAMAALLGEERKRACLSV
jgi:4-hydroxy-tetrahydrodipicolinate synthase